MDALLKFFSKQKNIIIFEFKNNFAEIPVNAKILQNILTKLKNIKKLTLEQDNNSSMEDS